MKKRFSYPIAFSDHSPGFNMDIAALTLGVNLVEKTITEDRMTRAVEHAMSIEPNEMKNFIETIREVEIAFGSNMIELHAKERKKRDQIRRSLFLLSDAKSGQKLSECNVEFRRPGYGIPPDQYELLSNAVLNKDRNSGEMLKMSDLEFK